MLREISVSRWVSSPWAMGTRKCDSTLIMAATQTP